MSAIHAQQPLQQKQRKMEPFYWILTFEGLTVLFLLALSLVIGPVILAVLYPNGWTYGLLVLILPGLWLLRVSIRLFSKYIWSNNHLNTYSLYEDHLEYKQYDQSSRECTEGSIPIRHMEQAYLSRYLAMYHYAYKKTGFFDKQSLSELTPALYIVFDDGFTKGHLEIPFYDLNVLNEWLIRLQEQGVPIRGFIGVINTMQKSVQLEHLLKPENSIPFDFDGNLQLHYQGLLAEMDKRLKELQSSTGSNQSSEGKTTERSAT